MLRIVAYQIYFNQGWMFINICCKDKGKSSDDWNIRFTVAYKWKKKFNLFRYTSVKHYHWEMIKHSAIESPWRLIIMQKTRESAIFILRRKEIITCRHVQKKIYNVEIYIILLFSVWNRLWAIFDEYFHDFPALIVTEK